MHFRQIANCLKMKLTVVKVCLSHCLLHNLYTTLIVFTSVVTSSEVKILNSQTRDWLIAKQHKLPIASSYTDCWSSQMHSLRHIILIVEDLSHFTGTATIASCASAANQIQTKKSRSWNVAVRFYRAMLRGAWYCYGAASCPSVRPMVDVLSISCELGSRA